MSVPSAGSVMRAISGPLRRSHDFRTPAPRGEYWGFLPFGLLLPGVAGWLSVELGADRWVAVTVAAAALIPLIAVTTRRAIDSGEAPSVVLRPTLDLAGLLACLFILDRGSRTVLATLNATDGPAGFGIAVSCGFAGLFVLLLAVRFLASGLIFGTALFSQMAAPTGSASRRSAV